LGSQAKNGEYGAGREKSSGEFIKRKNLFRLFFETMNLIPAIKKDKELINEMDHQPQANDHFYLWWLGQSGYLLQWKNQRVLIDPYLSDSLTKKYSQTDKPHIRLSERVVNPSLLKNISIVSSSHNHTDHLDAETLDPILQNNPGIRFIIPEANRLFVADRLNTDPGFFTGLDAGKSVTIGDFSFHGIPAAHNEIEKNENGNCRFLGYVIAFGKWKIYHSGDTLLFDSMHEFLKLFSIDIAILPINGNDPSRGVAGNLNIEEAIELAKSIGALCLIPCHYDMFQFNTADIHEFAGKAKQAGQSFRILKGGERFEWPVKS
jgi:L-ascorbate metabolism protein UlaG (beta-lactamase superfamily)